MKAGKCSFKWHSRTNETSAKLLHRVKRKIIEPVCVRRLMANNIVNRSFYITRVTLAGKLILHWNMTAAEAHQFNKYLYIKLQRAFIIQQLFEKPLWVPFPAPFYLYS